MTNPTDELAESDGLPPLPEAEYLGWAEDMGESIYAYTATQLREYARACLAGQAAAPEGAAVAWMPKSYHDMTLQELQREQGALNAAVYAKLGGAGGITVSCATAPTTQEPK